jgi:RNA polymerase sigma factor (sigma-70 family)
VKSSLEDLARKSREDDKSALEELIRRIQDRILGICLRMLYHPVDAEDAAQEILLKIVTHLGGFRGESAFTTWMFRIASNHLLNVRRSQKEYKPCSFEEYERNLDRESAVSWYESESDAQQELIVEEIRISCLQSLLLCLDRGHRLAFILVHIFDMTGDQGAEILDITPQAFRKRLSRARTRICDFMLKNCSLINPANRCCCERIAERDIKNGSIDSKQLVFATHPCRVRRDSKTISWLKEINELKRINFLFKLYPDIGAPKDFVVNIRKLITTERYEFL